MITTVKSFEFIKEYIKSLPDKPGVYRMLDANAKVLYVGKAKNLKKRVSNYTTEQRLTNRLIRMVQQVVAIEIIITKSEAEALLLEATLIKNLQPKYNILLRDDKSFPYIHIDTSGDFPKVKKYRGNRKEKGYFYGPFASTIDVNKAISELQKIFLIRNCTDPYFASRKRPCLEYQIKRCSAPCVNLISKEEYNTSIQAANDFLKGKTSNAIKDLENKMQQASDNLDYEKAGWFRDRINAIKNIRARNQLNLTGKGDVDVIAISKTDNECCIQVFFFRGGQSYGNKPYFPIHTKGCSEAEIIGGFLGQFYQTHMPPSLIWLNIEYEDAEHISSLLTELSTTKVEIQNPKKGDALRLVEFASENAKLALEQRLTKEQQNLEKITLLYKTFNLPYMPERLEVYDNSHISGTSAIGAFVVFEINGFNKREYKKFNISSTSISDDYQMLRETLTRRFKRLVNEQPDYLNTLFLLIDGGKGQQTIVEEVMKEFNLNIPYLCIAKGKDRNAGREHFFGRAYNDITFDKDEPVMKFLQNLRDEAHRFAITSHRKKRSSLIKKSVLKDISGIGPKKTKILFDNLGSIDQIKQLSIDDLQAIKGINTSDAKAIYEYFNLKNKL